MWFIFLIILYLVLCKWGPKDDHHDREIFIPFGDRTNHHHDCDGMDHPHNNHHNNDF